VLLGVTVLLRSRAIKRDHVCVVSAAESCKAWWPSRIALCRFWHNTRP